MSCLVQRRVVHQFRLPVAMPQIGSPVFPETQAVHPGKPNAALIPNELL